MRTWLINLWDSFRTGFWFVPTLMIIAAVLLATVLPEVDKHLSSSTPEWIKTTGDTARSTLSSLASAVLTVAGVIFSITVVTLSITSSQLGPRLLRNFLGESVTQITMGSCVSCSIYCLILLWRIDDANGEWFVPHLSVALATLMTLGVLCIVIYFIHRVAHSVQSMNVVADVANDLDQSIQRLFPDSLGDHGSTESSKKQLLSKLNEEKTKSVCAPRDGYLQAVDSEVLFNVSKEKDLLIVLDCRPGDFLITGRPVARCLPEDKCDDDTAKKLGDAFLVGNRRTPRQDIQCAINELVEVAVRALSPGINDPFTVIASIDRLSATFCRLATRETPAAVRLDDDGNPRVVTNPIAFPDALQAGFDQIRQYGATSIAVSQRLLHACSAIAESTHRQVDRDALARQVELTWDGVQQHSHCQGDLQEVKAVYELALAACKAEA